MTIVAVTEIETEMVFNGLKTMVPEGSNAPSARRTMAGNGLLSNLVTNRLQADKQNLVIRNLIRLASLQV